MSYSCSLYRIVKTVFIDFLPQKQLSVGYKMQNLIRLLLAQLWSASQISNINNIYFFSAYNSHCSDQSGVSLFSLTDVWNFSFPRPIVTKASLVPADMIFLTDINRGGRAVVWCVSHCPPQSQTASFITNTNRSFPSRLTPWLSGLQIKLLLVKLPGPASHC